mgnify:CR=1 FL=1
MSSDSIVRRSPDEDESLSTAIVSALSEAEGRDLSRDDCALYDTIDPDGLDSIFRQDSEGDNIKVEFATHGAIVVLWGNGQVTVEVQDLESESNAT